MWIFPQNRMRVIYVTMTVSLFTFNGQFENFFWPNLVITDSEKYTLRVQVYKIQQAANANLTDDIKMMGIIFEVLPQFISTERAHEDRRPHSCEFSQK